MPPRRIIRRGQRYRADEDVELEQVEPRDEPAPWNQGEPWARLDDINRSRHIADEGRRWPEIGNDY